MYNLLSTQLNLTLQLASFTKDSMNLQWHIDHVNQGIVNAYRVRYQALESDIIQYSPMLENTKTAYDIAKLHEDTDYNVCVEVYTKTMNVTKDSSVYQCIQASTSTDSLTVALGSTFGAFLALGIIVMFVFLAKWQHKRRMEKQQIQQVAPSYDSYDSMDQVEGDYEMSDVSLQVQEECIDDALKIDLSSQSSQAQSMTANGTHHLNHLPPDIEEDDEYEEYHSDLEGNVIVHELLDSGHDSPMSPESPPRPSTSSADYPISVAIGAGDSPTDVLLYPMSQSYPQNQDGRPPDVRPKDKALLDLTHMYANKKLFEQPQSQLRPNMSCNW